MSKIVKTYCPICDRITAHEIYTTNDIGERGIERILTAVFTLCISELEPHIKCKCLNCGKCRDINNGSNNLRMSM